MVHNQPNSAGSSVGGIGHLSHDEWHEPDIDSVLRRNGVAQMSRDAEVSEYAVDGPVVVGPGLPPEDGSCRRVPAWVSASTDPVPALRLKALSRFRL